MIGEHNMFAWIKNLFAPQHVEEPQESEYADNDMRVSPIDNPFDYREDGSIREGDPAWAMMMEAMNSGGVVMGTQKDDGTWDVKHSKE